MKPIITVMCLLFSIPLFSQTAEEIRNASNAFLESLVENQKQEITYEFEDSLRKKWTNLPVGLAKRPGLKYGDLSEESKIKFHHLLTSIFSSQGYLKTTSIMKLDDILNEIYDTAFERELISEKNLNNIKKLDWDFTNYYVSFWNKPDPKIPWGIKFGGHHISFNLTAVGDDYAVTPLFLGTDPAEVQITKYAGLRVLSKEEDYGIKLINMLSDEQQKIATLNKDVPKDIITNPSSSQRISEYSGIKASELNKEQQNLLRKLIGEYINNLESEKAQLYTDKIEASGFDNIYFAWVGSFERLKPHYYIINGPDFLIEYDNVGFNNDGNHIHTIWREKGNDFGEDILKDHYLKHKH